MPFRSPISRFHGLFTCTLIFKRLGDIEYRIVGQGGRAIWRHGVRIGYGMCIVNGGLVTKGRVYPALVKQDCKTDPSTGVLRLCNEVSNVVNEADASCLVD